MNPRYRGWPGTGFRFGLPVGSGWFCRMENGEQRFNSYASSIALPQHWALVDHVAIVRTVHKPVGSTEGHALADTSPLQFARVADTPPRRLDFCRTAILSRDFNHSR